MSTWFFFFSFLCFFVLFYSLLLAKKKKKRLLSTFFSPSLIPFPSPQISQDTNKRTPMHWAADFGHTEVLRYLHSKGANVNATDNFGITPLLAAVYEVRFVSFVLFVCLFEGELFCVLVFL